MFDHKDKVPLIRLQSWTLGRSGHVQVHIHACTRAHTCVCIIHPQRPWTSVHVRGGSQECLHSPPLSPPKASPRRGPRPAVPETCPRCHLPAKNKGHGSALPAERCGSRTQIRGQGMSPTQPCSSYLPHSTIQWQDCPTHPPHATPALGARGEMSWHRKPRLTATTTFLMTRMD